MADDFQIVKARLLLKLPEYLQIPCERGRKTPIRCPFHKDTDPSAVLFFNGEHVDRPVVLCKSVNCPQCGQIIDLFGAIQILQGLDKKAAWRWACDHYGEKVARTPRPQATPRQHAIEYVERSPEEIAQADAAFFALLKTGKVGNAAQTPTIAPQSPPNEKVGQSPQPEPQSVTEPRVSPYLTAALNFSQGEIFSRVLRILKKDNPTWTDAQIQKRAAWEAEMQFNALRGRAIATFGG